jgi:hypothetical protein
MEAHARWAFEHTRKAAPEFVAALQACEAPEEVLIFEISATEF